MKKIALSSVAVSLAAVGVLVTGCSSDGSNAANNIGETLGDRQDSAYSDYANGPYYRDGSNGTNMYGANMYGTNNSGLVSPGNYNSTSDTGGNIFDGTDGMGMAGGGTGTGYDGTLRNASGASGTTSSVGAGTTTVPSMR